MIPFPERLMLSSGQLTIELLPEWGSKMISFRTEPDGYEFLSPPPYGPHVPDSAIHGAEDAYGFDEMFPGVYPQAYPAEPWQQERIADHGDLWYRVWERSGGGTQATLWVADERLGWHFAKRLRFTDPVSLETQYRVENRSQHPLHWLYCAHILCPFREGIELELPAGRYRRLETFGQPLPEVCEADAAHLARQEAFPSQSAAFYVSDEMGASRCLYRDRRAGKALVLSWTAPLAYLGVWYNKAGWADDKPLTHVGLEPTTAGNQDLAEWVKSGSSRPLQPGEAVTWTMTMAVLDEGQAATDES